MTKINKKQLYVIAGLAGIIATAGAFAVPLPTAESFHDPSSCPATEAFHLIDERCIPIGSSLCPFEDADNHCIPPEPPTDPPTKVNTICPQENVQHWDKIIFKVKLKGNENKIFNTMMMPTVLEIGLTYDVKVLDDPETVAELERKVSSKLTDLGYLVEKKLGNNITTQQVARTNIEIIDVEYAIACISNAVDPDPPGGPTT